MILKPDYIMGDLHLGNDCRLFNKVYSKDFKTLEDYHKAIIENWNKKATNDDKIVYVIGDVGKKEAIEEIFPKLRGRKILIMGNHDTHAKSFYKKYFEEVYNHPVFVSSRIVLSHIPTPTEPGVINLHGHTHHVFLKSDRHFNLCPEHHDYTPILFKKLERHLGNIPKPNHNFLEEWYKDIQLTNIPEFERDDIVLREDKTIDVEKSKPLIFLKRYKGKVRKGLAQSLTDAEILELYEKQVK